MLKFRSPSFPWGLTAVIGALALHGLTWFVTRSLVPGANDAVAETGRQVMLSLFWMIGTFALWSVKVPKSRRGAVFSALTCVGFVGIMGSIAAFIKLVLYQHVPLHMNTALAFGGFSFLMVVAQLALAVPSAFVLQQIALSRAAKT